MTKDEPEIHGFGLQQISAVMKKCSGIRDVKYTENVFTVCARLNLPDKPSSGR